MQPWVIDANDMQAEDLVPFQSNLLHSNLEIQTFLSDNNKTKMIVIAPKGFGKTLLLKAKRISTSNRYSCVIPKDALVDKPIGAPSVISSAEYDNIREEESYWKSAWLIAMTIAILKVSGPTPANISKNTSDLFSHPSLFSACDIFDTLVSMAYSEFYKVYNDLNRHLLPAFRTIHTPVAIFIDNVDEYYEALLRGDRTNTIAGRIHKSFWYFAQIGCALSARELNHLNNHVKIYVSI